MLKDNFQHVNVLWTGGMDSSFTMIKLSRLNIEIQPYYLCDNRDSESFELQAISQITEDIRQHPHTKCTILPLIKLKTADVELDTSITNAYQKLERTTKIGSQYDWLARFAKNVEELEISLEKSENCKASACILKYGGIKRVNKGELIYYVLDKEVSSQDLIAVFGNLHFSLVWDYSKKEEMDQFKQLGFEESLKKTWFCFTPINGKPCGLCNPCKAAIGDGMQWRFEKDALIRYRKAKMKTLLRPPFKFIKKVYYFACTYYQKMMS